MMMLRIYEKMYEKKKTTAQKAVQLVEPGEGIIFPIMPGEPPALLEALPMNGELSGNTLYRMLPSFPTVDISPNKLKQVSIFLSGMDRKGFNQGNIDLLPNHFSDIPALLKRRTNRPVIMATVSPMDEEGNFSLGTSPSYVASLIKDAKTIILEVNKHMPRTFGEKNTIHISEVAALVEHDFELPTLPNPKLSEKDLAIGKIIAETVKDGDTVQIGFGSMPNAVMEYLMDKRNLGIHSEMLPDKIVDLYEEGVVNNKYKTTYPTKTVSTFAIGSKRLYEFMDNNPDILMLPCDVTNDIREIAKIDNLKAINSSVEVDFLGQCNSEMVKGTYYSSTGGQADFTKGVRLSNNGRGIICLYSTAKKDSISTIVPELALGSAVSTSKNDIDTIVTEYGKAELIGKTVQERTESLIEVAHPNFREELRQKAIEKCFITEAKNNEKEETLAMM
ncbi:acetyl-CoA hydrolase/transferase family protein [Carnobacterium antarcticum]|nr:acetyl-CoA hydrolase/transferase C-terminal domain-containing protein [Carnobacterium sp. CP1]